MEIMEYFNDDYQSITVDDENYIESFINTLVNVYPQIYNNSEGINEFLMNNKIKEIEFWTYDIKTDIKYKLKLENKSSKSYLIPYPVIRDWLIECGLLSVEEK